MSYNAIVYSSGGSKGICHLGALYEIRKQKPHIVSDVKYHIGTSAGSVAAAFSALNISPRDAFEAYVIPFEYVPNRRLDVFPRVFGFDTSKSLSTFMYTIVGDLTFQDILMQYDNVLAIVATDVSTRGMKLFDPIRTPDVLVRDALRASCSVPFVFPYVLDEEEHVLVDGAISNSFPINVARDIYGCDKILGFHFIEDHEKANPITSFYGYVNAIIDTMVNANSDRTGRGIDICSISVPADVNPLGFDVSIETKEKLYKLGRKAAFEFLNT